MIILEMNSTCKTRLQVFIFLKLLNLTNEPKSNAYYNLLRYTCRYFVKNCTGCQRRNERSSGMFSIQRPKLKKQSSMFFILRVQTRSLSSHHKLFPLLGYSASVSSQPCSHAAHFKLQPPFVPTLWVSFRVQAGHQQSDYSGREGIH